MLRADAAESPKAFPGRGIITFAFGRPRFHEMAKTLARSLALHSPGFPRAVIADRADAELRRLFHHVIPFQRELGSNWEQKLFLDQYSPFEHTLYLDSDCIVVRDVEFVFNEFAGRPFGVPGRRDFSRGEIDYACDVDRLLDEFGLDSMPKFNGGLYCFDRSAAATKLFETARALLEGFEARGFREVGGGGPSDERILSVAMAMNGETIHLDRGSMMRTPLGLVGRIRMDVLAGRCSFQKNQVNVAPAVMHFAQPWCWHPLYRREARKLRMISSENLFVRRAARVVPTALYPFEVATSLTAAAGAAKRTVRFARRTLNLARSRFGAASPEPKT